MMLFADEEAVQPKAIQLFDYQEEDRTKVATAFLDKNLFKLLGVWPTGSGKTVLFSELHLEPRMRAWLHTFPPNRRKILVIAHRDELIKQAVQKIARSNPDLAIGVEKASQRSKRTDDVIVASVQTLTASKGKRLKQLDPARFRIIVVDEAHHGAAASYHLVLQHFGFLPPPPYMAETRPEKEDGRLAILNWQRARLSAWDSYVDPQDKLLLGVTATAKRGDNIGLECVFQDIVFERSIREMIEKGRLSRMRAYRVKSRTSLDNVGTRAGDFEQDKLGQAVNVDERNAVAVKAYMEFAEGLKGITFCATVAHAVSMAEAYNAVGVRAACIHGKLSDTDRAQMLKDYTAGRIVMLTNCQILTEGFDEPDVQVIVHARPTKSSLLYIQMTGRGLRVCPGKEECVIIDIVDITKKHSLMSSPELLGLPANFDAKGADLLECKEQVESLQAQFPLKDLTDAKSIDDCLLEVAEVDLLGNFTDPVLDNNAKLLWEKLNGSYELSWKGALLNEFLTVTPDIDGWKAQYLKGTIPQWTKTEPTADAALQTAETWLKKNKPSTWSLTSKQAKDNHLPATAETQKMIERFGIKVNAQNLTRGQARQLLQHHYHQKRKYR